jgi:hypothetical protein
LKQFAETIAIYCHRQNDKDKNAISKKNNSFYAHVANMPAKLER